MKTTKLILRISQVAMLVMFTTMSFGCWNMPQEDRSSGNYIKEEREVGNFSSLDIGGAFTVILSQGSEEKLVLEADAEEMSEIITEVVGDELKIHTKPGWNERFHEMTVYLTFKNLDNLDFSGAVEVKAQEALTFDGLTMDVSGASEIDLDFTASKLEADFSGASELNFTGKCDKGYIEISGAGEINAENMEFTDLVIELSGASQGKVFATGVLKIDASGASTVKYKGGAKVSVNTSGASQINEL
jgi:hypothetical protein